MNARELYRDGRLEDAIATLNDEIRDNPTDIQLRTFLFELLAFAGDHERASKQLAVLARNDPEAAIGILSYQNVLDSAAERSKMFADGTLPESASDARPVRGRLNGKPFERLEDADPRVGPRLEVFIEGQYRWLPLEHLSAVRMEVPRRLRDLLWAPVEIDGGPSLDGVDLGGALLPVLTPSASGDEDDQVKLGRITKWIDLDDGREAPVGQKMLLVDDEDVPLLELRELVIDGPSDTG